MRANSLRSPLLLLSSMYPFTATMAAARAASAAPYAPGPVTGVASAAPDAPKPPAPADASFRGRAAGAARRLAPDTARDACGVGSSSSRVGCALTPATSSARMSRSHSAGFAAEAEAATLPRLPEPPPATPARAPAKTPSRCSSTVASTSPSSSPSSAEPGPVPPASCSVRAADCMPVASLDSLFRLNSSASARHCPNWACRVAMRYLPSSALAPTRRSSFATSSASACDNSMAAA